MREAPVATVLDATVATPTLGTPRLGIRGTGELRTMTAHVTFANPGACEWAIAGRGCGTRLPRAASAESLVGIARR